MVRAVSSDLAHVDTWIFDLDNTLYPASSDLFGLVDRRMTAYVARVTGLDEGAARTLQKRYFREHGTTLTGLMMHHGVDPRHFLDDVHAIEMAALREDRRLIDSIAHLPGRKLVFTNGDADYAGRVLARLGLSRAFEAIHDIHACAYRAKPDAASYASLVERLGVDPARALFADDMSRNLLPAKALGMTTVWVHNGSEQAGGVDGAHIDYRTDDLGAWLAGIIGETA